MDPTADLSASYAPKRSYSAHYLKSFAERCRKSPLDIDLRGVNDELSNEVPQWRKEALSLSSVSPGKRGRRRRNRLKKPTSVPFQHEIEKGWSKLPKNLKDDDEPMTSASVEATQETASDGVVNDGDRSRISSNSFDKTRRVLAPLQLRDHDQSASRVDVDTPNSVENEYFTSSDDVSDTTKTHHLKLVHVLQSSDSGGSSPVSTPSPIDLGSLFVKERHRAKPMPAARTLQDIEKEIVTSKIKPKIVVGRQKSFLTCEDVEQSILADISDGSSSAADFDSSTSERQQRWLGGEEDKAASEHLLSVLQKKPTAEKELGSSVPVSTDLSNLDNVLKRYERLAAADFLQAVSESKQGAEDDTIHSPKPTTTGLASTVDSLRTSVSAQNNTLEKTSGKNTRKSKAPPAKSWKGMPQPPPQIQNWMRMGLLRSAAAGGSLPNVFLQTGPAVETPLVPQALQALQRLVDHQLHILNSIPGEVTPGMLHERLSRSVMGYPPTGTQLLSGCYGVPPVASASYVPFFARFR